MLRAERSSRRAFIGGAALLAPTLAGCDKALSYLAEAFGGGVPSAFTAPGSARADDVQHVLSRTSFGVWPGDWERVTQLGIARYLDEQLEPRAIDDTACDLRAEAIDSVHMDEGLLFELPPEQIESELGRHALLRATYSKRQLEEVMVEMWSDHFHVAIGKSFCQHLLPAHDRAVIRRHALGNFRELLAATALSAAMLVYLDGRDNKVGAAGEPANENYARELLELHTLGVHGGYSQADVMAAARCLTGFVVQEKWAPGTVDFVPERHDDGEKIVLGQVIARGGGRADLDRLLDILAFHPSTARHVARKIAATFVADDPPESVIEKAAATFGATGGDIRAVVRTVLTSDEFCAQPGSKIKRPFRFVVSALRALGADTHGKGALVSWLGRMGHAPYAWPTPDGYPARGEAWLATLLLRFRFAFELTQGTIEHTAIDTDRLERSVRGDDKLGQLLAHVFGRVATARERDELGQVPARALALAISSPTFQRF